ncbi:MAG: nitroreductase [Candidatus Nanohaloarchaea archaeon]|jgi:nitroreductase
MSSLEAVQSITSFRDCRDEVIPRKILGRVLEAARQTPSPGNVNLLEFVIVEDDGKLESLSRAVDDKRVKKAPSSVVVLADMSRAKRNLGDEAYHAANAEAASSVQNMRVVASEHDLSSVWLSGFNRQDVGEMLNAPSSKEAIAIVSFGYTNNPVPIETKFGMNEIFSYDEYGSQVGSVFDSVEWDGIREEKRIYGKKADSILTRLKQKIRKVL